MITTFYSYGAMYTEIDYFKIAKVPTLLGDAILKPGILVNKIGEKARTSFEMQDNCYLEYIGRYKENDSITLLFAPYPRKKKLKKVDRYYSFCYIDKNTLLIMNERSGYDINVNHLKTFIKEEIELVRDSFRFNNFDIKVKTFNKDYSSNLYKIKKPYILKEGDRLFSVHYDRGTRWDDVKILEVTNTHITIGDHWLWKDKTFTLQYDYEPNYKEILGPEHDLIIAEERNLVIEPFPVFLEKPNFKHVKALTSESFYKNQSRVNYEEYVRNFENVI